MSSWEFLSPPITKFRCTQIEIINSISTNQSAYAPRRNQEDKTNYPSRQTTTKTAEEMRKSFLSMHNLWRFSMSITYHGSIQLPGEKEAMKRIFAAPNGFSDALICVKIWACASKYSNLSRTIGLLTLRVLADVYCLWPQRVCGKFSESNFGYDNSDAADDWW